MIKTIDIEEAKVYEVAEKLYLYKDGDECVDVTGGWSARNLNGGVLTKNPTDMVLSGTSTSSVQAFTNNPIDLSGYSTYCIEVSSSSSVKAVAQCVIDRSAWQNAIVLEESVLTSGVRTISAPIGSNNNIYMGFSRFGARVSLTIKRIWLE